MQLVDVDAGFLLAPHDLHRGKGQGGGAQLLVAGPGGSTPAHAQRGSGGGLACGAAPQQLVWRGHKARSTQQLQVALTGAQGHGLHRGLLVAFGQDAFPAHVLGRGDLASLHTGQRGQGLQAAARAHHPQCRVLGQQKARAHIGQLGARLAIAQGPHAPIGVGLGAPLQGGRTAIRHRTGHGRHAACVHLGQHHGQAAGAQAAGRKVALAPAGVHRQHAFAVSAGAAGGVAIGDALGGGLQGRVKRFAHHRTGGYRALVDVALALRHAHRGLQARQQRLLQPGVGPGRFVQGTGPTRSGAGCSGVSRQGRARRAGKRAGAAGHTPPGVASGVVTRFGRGALGAVGHQQAGGLGHGTGCLGRAHDAAPIAAQHLAQVTRQGLALPRAGHGAAGQQGSGVQSQRAGAGGVGHGFQPFIPRGSSRMHLRAAEASGLAFGRSASRFRLGQLAAHSPGHDGLRHILGQGQARA